ncbi:3-hydroxybutyryl-CoA dehydratase [Siccirubricoccus deserti]|nr:enoyl-CoA hydratase-related protein [Siccirubricoccus deserti]GGC37435.1 3-hydroxybutyryl-CoA dehydratase [Siccirubricoccus deserti]
MDGIELRRDASGVVTVSLTRPEKRNAVSLAMWRALGPLYRALGADPAVRAVILTGAGHHFCAGADISEFAAVRSTLADIAAYEEAADGATAAIRDCPKPTIAAVSGYGVGGGCGLALACDLRVGDATTRMGIPAARRGVVYGALDTGLLLRAVGLSAAKLILYSARLLPAADCLRLGLLNEVAPAAALPAAEALAAEIAANAPLSVAGAKRVLEVMAAGDEAARAAEIHAIVERAATSDDYREASRSFVEKRAPVFRGH